MTPGVSGFRTLRDLWIDRMLLQPFASPARVRQEDYSPSVSETAPMEIKP